MPKPSDHTIEERDLKWAATVACLDPKKYIQLTPLPGVTLKNFFEPELKRVERALDVFSPKVIGTVRACSSLSQSWVLNLTGLATHNYEPSTEVKLSLFLYGTRDIVERRKAKVKRSPTSRQLQYTRWASKVRKLNKMVMSSTLEPMELSKALSFDRVYQEVRSIAAVLPLSYVDHILSRQPRDNQ